VVHPVRGPRRMEGSLPQEPRDLPVGVISFAGVS